MQSSPSSDADRRAATPFVLLRRIGRGGEGAVYLAEQESLERQVAIKLFTANWEPGDSALDTLARTDLRDDRRSGGLFLTLLNHPSIPDVIDFAYGSAIDPGVCRADFREMNDVVGLVMKFVDGPNWSEVLARRSPDPGFLEAQLATLVKVCEAVEHAHERGIIHRDLKPGQVVIEKDTGEVFLVDWDMAAVVDRKLLQEKVGHDQVLPSLPVCSVGFAHGTSGYRAPEQHESSLAPTSRATDVYQLGATLCEILGGAPPHSTGDPLAPTRALAHEVRDSPHRVAGCTRRGSTDIDALLAACGAPAELRRLAVDAMFRQPRMSSVADFKARLVGYLTGHRDARRSNALLADVASRLETIVTVEDHRALANMIDEAAGCWSANPGLAVARDRLSAAYARCCLRASDLASARAAAIAISDPELRNPLTTDIDRRSRLRRLVTSSAIATTALLLALTAAFAIHLQRSNRTIREGNERLQRSTRALERSNAELTRRKVDLETANIELVQANERSAEQLLRTQRAEYAASMLNVQTAIADGRYRDAERLLLACRTELVGWEWGYFLARCHRERLMIPFTSGAFYMHSDQTGRRVLIGTAGSFGDTNIGQVVDTATAQVVSHFPTLRVFTDREGPVCAGDVAISRSGKWVAGPDTSGTLHLIEADTGSSVRVFPDADGAITCTAIAESGETLRVLAASDDIWEVTGDKQRRLIRASNGIARIFDAKTGNQVAELVGHAKGITSAEFDRTGAHVITASRDGTARIWSASSGECEHVLRGHDGMLWRATFSPSGELAATAGSDGDVLLWDVATGGRRAALEGHTMAVVHACFSPDGASLLTTSLDQTARLWEVDTGTCRQVLEGHRWWVWDGVFSPDGTLVTTASKDRTVRIWQTSDGAILDTLLGHTDMASGSAFLPDGRIITSGEDHSLRIWDPLRPPWEREHRLHRESITRARYSADGERLIVGSADGSASVWSTQDATQTVVIRPDGGVVHDVGLDSAGRLAVIGSANGTVTVWDVTTGDETTSFVAGSGAVVRVAVLPDDGGIFAGTREGSIGVWRLDGSSIWHTSTAPARSVLDIAYDPTHQIIALLEHQPDVRLYSLRDGTPCGRLNARESGLNLPGYCGGEFFRNGDRLALLVGSEHNGTGIRVFDVAQDREVVRLESDTYDLNGLSVSPTGDRIAAGEREGTVRVWDAESGRELCQIAAHIESGQRVCWTTFAPVKSGGALLTACRDGNVRTWGSLPVDLHPSPDESYQDWRVRLAAFQRAQLAN